jgi:dipeptidyl aminopeptidase/acylaminoacyl peptidase
MAARLTWSPDGRRWQSFILPALTAKPARWAPGARDVGVIGTIVDEQRLATIDVATGSIRLLTPADTYIYEYGWSPDGRAIAVTYAEGNGDNNWWVAWLARVDVATATMRDLFAPPFQLNDPQWSPDGTRIAVIGGIMSDFGSTGGDLYLVDANTGAAHDVTPDAPISVQSLHWNDASSLDLLAHVPGAMHLLRLDIASGRIATLTDRDESIGSWSSRRGGSIIALVRSSFADAPEIWAGSPSALRRISNHNAGAVRLYGKAVSLRWTSGGFSDQGWLIYPLDYDAAHRYPRVTIAHGGPSAQSAELREPKRQWTLLARLLRFHAQSARQFRSGGSVHARQRQGFRLRRLARRSRGRRRRDRGRANRPESPGAMGWSYGGYMAMCGETQTTRFKAIVAGAGIVSWQFYYGQNKIDQWMIPFFGASVYQDPAVYARSSPITFMEQSKTPVLILQGERDEEVPAPQAFEFWHAMETLGVPTKLIVYADEGHGPQQISNQIDILEQTLEWFQSVRCAVA